MIVRLDNSFERAEMLVRRSLSNTSNGANNCIAFGAFNSRLDNYCSLKNYEVCNLGRDPDDDANLTLSLRYSITEPDELGVLVHCDKERTINLLSTVGDIYWTPNMILKVFDGEYPSTVGYDTASGEVFLVYIMSSGMVFRYFATLSPEHLSAFEDLNRTKPYKIDIEPRAMFRVLDGAEGTNHLKQNLFIEFDCIHPVILPIDTTVERIY